MISTIYYSTSYIIHLFIYFTLQQLLHMNLES